jgi:type IV pilus assembly protein PilA
MQQPYPPQPPPPKKGMSVGLIILIVLSVTIVPIIGILAVLGIYGTRKYIANAKTAEAKNTLAQIAKDAAIAFEEGGKGRRLCSSASAPVPAARSDVSGKKYQSSQADWTTDSARNAGFACLKFEMSSPQYFQYEYEATATSFVARAHGDLNGDGVFSTFEINGRIVDERLVISPSILEVDPGE